jgi:hypothetical protein
MSGLNITYFELAGPIDPVFAFAFSDLSPSASCLEVAAQSYSFSRGIRGSIEEYKIIASHEREV